MKLTHTQNSQRKSKSNNNGMFTHSQLLFINKILLISSDTHVIMYDAIKAGKHYVNTQKPPPEREQTSTHT